MVRNQTPVCVARATQRETEERRSIASAAGLLAAGKPAEASATLAGIIERIQSIDSSEPFDDERGSGAAAQAVLLEAEACLGIGDPGRAIAVIQKAEQMGWLAADSLRAAILRAESLLAKGLPREAREIVNRELKTTGGGPGLADRARLLMIAGAAEEDMGRPRQARRRLRDAVALARAGGARNELASSLLDLSGFLRRAGRLADAAENMEEAETAARAAGTQPILSRASLERMRLLQAEGRHSEALDAVSVGHPGDAAGTGGGSAIEIGIVRAEILTACGRWKEASETLRELSGGIADRRSRERALAQIALGDAAKAGGDRDGARHCYLLAKTFCEGCAREAEVSQGIDRRLGELLRERGDARRAMPLLRKAAAAAARHGWSREHGKALLSLGRAEAEGGMPGKACRDLAAAASRFSAAEAPDEEASALLAEAEVRCRMNHDSRRLARAGGPGVAAHLGDTDRDRPRSVRALIFRADELFRSSADEEGSAACAALAAELESTAAAGLYGPAKGVIGRIREGDGDGPRVVAESHAMSRALAMIDMVAPAAEPVLIVGETGTGKELAARRIHRRSDRAAGAFVAVNCSAVPDSMFEREFFGHRRGAFTGADESSPGFCQRADGGTLFLDEIGDMSPALQVKLLRLLQEGTFQMLGDPVERSVDLRIVAATNADLGARMKEGSFRSDLYYRLQILTIELPPLRERPEDLEPLMRQFIGSALGRDVEPADLFDPAALRALKNYPWPGNVRELEGVTRRVAIMCGGGGRAAVDMLPERIARWSEKPGAARGSLDLGRHLDAAERCRIEHALLLCDGNRSHASRLLGISRNTLYKKLDRHGLG